MNAIARAIQVEQLTGTAAEIAAAFAADVELSRDSTAYTWSGLAIKLLTAGVDPMVVSGLDTVLVALPGGSMLGRMLASGGVDFTGPVLRAQLAAVAVSAPDYAGVIAAMLEIGIKTGPLWTKPRLGLNAAPDEASCADALARIATQQKWAQFSNEVVPPMLSAGRSWAEILAAGEIL